MFEAEENIRVPEDISEYIRKGITLGEKKKKANKRKVVINSLIICMLALFTVSVRTSQTFAAYISKIPGLEYLVRFINYDKGLQSAIENNFIQNINSSVTEEGIKFTIKDVIIDNSQAIIFYSLENEKDNRNIVLAKVDLTNGKGEEIIGTSSWGYNKPYADNGDNKIEDRIDISFKEGADFTDKFHIRVTLAEETYLNGERHKEALLSPSWDFELPIDKDKIKAMERIYTLNKQIEIQGQKITFKEIKITPTRTALEIEYDKNNSKKILGYENLRIVDEKNEIWGTIMNGVTASYVDENKEIRYFQSNYFNKPKKLYIKGEAVRALDKEQLEVVVDLENEKLLKAPDQKLSLRNITKNEGENETSISFSIEKDQVYDVDIFNSIFAGSFKDSEGNTYNQKRMEFIEDKLKEAGKKIINFVIDNNSKIKSPIYIKISDYPTRIKSPFEVRIK